MPLSKYVWAGITSLVVTLLSGVVVLPLLKKLKVGQPINKYLPEHNEKSGTPTMGGIIFVVPSVILSAFFTGLDMTALVACGLTLFYAAVGFADDFIKIKFNKNEGLTPLQKIVFQLLGALLAAAFAVRTEKTLVFIPFTDVFLDFGFWYFPFVAFVFLSLTNCVNLTDGLDGLAASSSVPVLFCVSALAFLNGGEQGLSLYAFIFAFSLVAFLFFNVYPAKVFMGDCGSLATGAAISCIACFSGNALYSALSGVCFVISGLSVIIQVLHYKRTKKRVFKMAPFHHHLQHSSVSEPRVAMLYFIISLLSSLVCFL